MPTWTNTQLERWMKDAEEDIVSQVYMRLVSFSLPIVAGTATYTLNHRIYRPVSLLWKGKPLSPYIGRELHAIRPRYREIPGEPTAYQLSNDGVSTLRLIPVPNLSISSCDSGLYSDNIENAFIIRAFTFPDRDLDYFQIPDYLQRNLIKCYVLARAFHAEGIGQNLKAAQYWQRRYMILVDQLRRVRSRYQVTNERLDIDNDLVQPCQKKRLPRLPPDFVISKAAYPLNVGEPRSSLNFWNDFIQLSTTTSGDLSVNVSDTLNNWADLIELLTTATGFNINVSDTLNNWLDSLLLGHGGIIGDGMTMGDGTGLNLGYFISRTDDLNNWNDEVSLFLVGGDLSISFSDTLNNWNDSLLLGYGHIFGDDANTMEDESRIILGYLIPFSDDLNNWNDNFTFTYGYALQFADTLNNWGEALRIGYGHLFTDNINNWADATVRRLDYLKTFSDSLNNWADATSVSLGGAGGLPSGADIIYEFNDASGQVLTDSSGNANHGQLGDTTSSEASDPAWATDGGDNVLDFTLSTDWVEIPRRDYSGAFTVVIVYNKDTTNDNQELITATDAGSTGQRVLARSASTQIRVAGNNDVTTASVSTNVWTMLSYRRDGSDKVDSFVNDGTALRLYADVAQTSTYGFDRIGGGGNATDMDGQIAFFACWPSALTDSQIQNDVYDYVKALKPGIGLP